MKIAVLGDIHGNHLALKAALADANKSGVKKLLIAGDFVGYYYHAVEAFNLLETWHFEAIQGNHDAILLSILDGNQHLKDKYREKYGAALEMTSKELSLSNLSFLQNLQKTKTVVFSKHQLLLCHGSPWDQDLYVYPDADESIFKKIASEPFDIVVMGHTHYPMIKKVNGKTLLNPGSVGQTRDRKPGACWALLDTNTMETSLKRSDYDPKPIINEVIKRDPHIPYLAQILEMKNDT